MRLPWQSVTEMKSPVAGILLWTVVDGWVERVSEMGWWSGMVGWDGWVGM